MLAVVTTRVRGVPPLILSFSFLLSPSRAPLFLAPFSLFTPPPSSPLFQRKHHHRDVLL